MLPSTLYSNMYIDFSLVEGSLSFDIIRTLCRAMLVQLSRASNNFAIICKKNSLAEITEVYTGKGEGKMVVMEKYIAEPV